MLLTIAYKLHTYLLALVSFFCILRYDYIDSAVVNAYQEYLGTVEEQAQCQQSSESAGERRVPQRGPGQVSTVVCNHTGMLDILALLVSPLMPGFTPRVETRDVPVLNKLTEGL